jgi:hypothetical protein
LNDHIRVDEMGVRASRARGGDKHAQLRIYVGKPEGRHLSEDLDVEGRYY